MHSNMQSVARILATEPHVICCSNVGVSEILISDCTYGLSDAENKH